MKLRIKETGEIVELVGEIKRSDGKPDFTLDSYDTLSQLCEAVEDYEEPKEYWYINEFGTPTKADFVGRETLYDKCRKNFGNYFETKEEAEKAVEKLKALTEAKEDGLKIKGYYYNHEDLVVLADIGKCNKPTLDTLFGKEID